MPGTKQSAAKAVKTQYKKYGPDYYAKIGQIGGRNGTGHKFGHGKVDPSVAGRTGGTKSRRGPKNG